VVTASALVGTVVAVVAVGLVSQLGSPDADGDSAVLSAGSVSSTVATAGSVPDDRTDGSTFPRAATGGQAWLGIQGTDDDDGEGGVLVTGVDRAGPAATAGLRTGDVIVGADRDEVESMGDLHAIIADARPGDVFVLDVVRGDVRIRMMAVLGERS
jgi:S1-C subfamily serine protease